ncbi:hypothetical protein H6P81_009188 [Aristolochia fimbriata]|uniref:Uncharacterized protein n=1 Tax=Aristolochia fimbriata TaxID=158543 RepID=A0AAV7EPP3_ARIFI|nr:hypothetical protein H6P81_009188 [Aristolochia fimbriata]
MMNACSQNEWAGLILFCQVTWKLGSLLNRINSSSVSPHSFREICRLRVLACPARMEEHDPASQGLVPTEMETSNLNLLPLGVIWGPKERTFPFGDGVTLLPCSKGMVLYHRYRNGKNLQGAVNLKYEWGDPDLPGRRRRRTKACLATHLVASHMGEARLDRASMFTLINSVPNPGR